MQMVTARSLLRDHRQPPLSSTIPALSLLAHSGFHTLFHTTWGVLERGGYRGNISGSGLTTHDWEDLS